MLKPRQSAPGTDTTPPTAGDGSVSAFLWRLLRPHAWWLLLACAFNCLSGMAVSAQTLIPKYLIDDILLPEHLDLRAKIRLIVMLCVGYLLVTIVWRMIVWHVGFRIFTRIREEVVREMRSAFFKHVNALCLRFHGTRQSGELFSYLFGSPLGLVQQFFQQFSALGPQSIFMIAGTVLWVGVWDWIVTLVLFIGICCSFAAQALTRGRIKKLHELFQNRERAVSGRVADLLQGTRHVKLHAIEEQVERKFAGDVESIGKEGVRRDVESHQLWMIQESVGYFAFVALCAVGSWRFLSGHIQLGEFTAYLAAFGSLQWPINSLLQLMNLQGGAHASLERIAEVLNTSSTTPEPSRKQPVPTAGFAIRFEGVTFSYGEKALISNLDLEIPYGQRVALVGPSGSGKSTLTQLILRLYDPQQGRILFGDRNIRDCSGPELRRLFGVVPQDPYFFRSTVSENVRLLKPNATDEEVRVALKQAQALDFVEALPEGLETMLGERGANISGGQRQRLAIARALLPSPPCLIFDEATSAVDPVGEAKIKSVLDQVLVGRTSILIAHRLSMAESFDRILVVSEGAIVQDGTYHELASKPGLFHDLLHGVHAESDSPEARAAIEEAALS